MAHGIGIIGCGNICGIYLENLREFGLPLRGCADLDAAKARQTAERYGVPAAPDVDSLLSDPDIRTVVNLTVPKAHTSVSKRCLEAGKHVYAEKPLGISNHEARATLSLADALGLRVGCAPDTVLGAGIQTARSVLDSGAIGEPLGFNAFMMCRGHESWHPSPGFYYEAGGGPMFDMGPYYLSALVTLLGPISDVRSQARATFTERLVTSQPLAGTTVSVETPTHIVAILTFESGAFGQITTSFDVAGHRLPHIEIYGAEGSLTVPDPNGFGGEVQILRRGDTEWQTVAHTHPYPENVRGLGVLDMVNGIEEGRPHRASGAVATHVVEVMEASLESATLNRTVPIGFKVDRPEAMPPSDIRQASM